MFSCVQCPEKFTVDDVEKGIYFVSTGICLDCYRKMFRNKVLCFGKERLFNPKTLACGEECPDRRICKGFVKHPKEYISKES